MHKICGVLLCLGLVVLPAGGIASEPSVAVQGGAVANTVGQNFESRIKALIVHKGYTEQTSRTWKHAKTRPQKAPKTLLTNAPYTNIYGGRGRSEFLLLPQGTLVGAVRIEAKWKQSPGSTDERLAVWSRTVVLYIIQTNHHGRTYGTGITRVRQDDVRHQSRNTAIASFAQRVE